MQEWLNRSTGLPRDARLVGYRVDEQLDSGKGWQYDMTVPSGFPELDMATCRIIGRYGGTTRDDAQFRSELYKTIGAIVVGGGHVEAAMKRVLLCFRGDNARFSLADYTWTDLEKELRKEADKGSEEDRVALGEALSWAAEREVKQHRDTAVHSYWWDYSGPSVRACRFHRKSEGVTIIYSLSDLDQAATNIFEYATRLDNVVGSRWSAIALLSDDHSIVSANTHGDE